MLYPFARGLFRGIFRVLWRWKISGLDNFPVKGPVVVVSNHVSNWDPIVIGTALPRPVHFMAKEELFRYPLLGNLLIRLNAFPVKRGQPDRSAIRRALEILGAGGVLGLFPEGSRSKTGELLKPQPGVAMIALKAKVPVLPVACVGTDKMGKKGSFFQSFEVRIGKPIEYIEYYEQKLSTKNLEIISQDIMEQIALLLRKE
ncbi:MAG: 1-acyl-sn-glycerol-3-phosphate acyltransferase [Syntrophomonadaceae bacterium]|nr:1-acyl-sn-glycerol-3-phosphate acyltransferase [Syntrophomonadaceae bacterium]